MLRVGSPWTRQNGQVQLIFLGILLDCKNFTLALPREKRVHALDLLHGMLDRKKVTVQEILFMWIPHFYEQGDIPWTDLHETDVC